ncbi:alpha/beta hydrolase [Iamia sp. SCSIO 61187]|uniref:alpha/beta hydrolase n=1 Tax=Iamia sp. SCSIO 61187 TaxID=2722752 RepID=UPI001C632DD4|nr:alpha/beta hydrolase [Iamia sp. SCSIO 61187]QYG95229.1 alpha/beta hydrolase [Iamia sp. SCSIO 61187]
MKWASVVVAITLVVAASACTPPSPAPPAVTCTNRTTRTTRDIPYASVPGVDPALLALDLTIPDAREGCGPTPVVVWVHGGGFAVGDKANGVDAMEGWAAVQGWAFASVNHRLSPRPPSDDPDRVLHPTHVGDVADAVGWLVDHAAERRLDPERIVLVGHSAGAFLVSMLATDDRYLADADVELSQVRAVASLDTRYDIVTEIAEGGATAEAMYRNAFGDDPAVWRDASPLTHAGTSPDEPPFVVVTRGQPARVESARTFAAALDEGTLVDASPLTHAEVGDALGEPGDTVITPEVTAAFEAALRA